MAAKGKPKDDGVHSFEGKPVVSAAVRVTNAGDGLSEAMRLDPQDLQHGEEIWLVVKGTVSKVAYEPIPKSEGTILQRVHTIKAVECVMVAPDEVEELLRREKDRVLKLKEEAQGVERLPLDADPLGVFDQDEAKAKDPAPVG